MEEELAIRVIPEERSVMLLQVSKTMRTAMHRVRPPAMITVKQGQRTESVKNAMLNLMKWCRITAIDLSYTSIKADGVGRLAAVLGQCASLAHLGLRMNGIGAEGAGRPHLSHRGAASASWSSVAQRVCLCLPAGLRARPCICGASA